MKMPRNSSAAADPSASFPKTVLFVVKSQGPLTQFLITQLERAGHAVFTASDFETAWSACNELHLHAALVFDNLRRETSGRRTQGPVSILDFLRRQNVPIMMKEGDPSLADFDGPIAYKIPEPLRLDQLLGALSRVGD